MILVEGTFWPLVVVGVIPDSGDTSEAVMTVEEGRLWSTDVLRLALVVAGRGSRAGAAHGEVFRWLRRHRTHLRRRTLRMAWIIEDDAIRACAEAWLALAGDRLFRARSKMFQELKPAVAWLVNEASTPEGVPAWHRVPADMSIQIGRRDVSDRKVRKTSDATA